MSKVGYVLLAAVIGLAALVWYFFVRTPTPAAAAPAATAPAATDAAAINVGGNVPSTDMGMAEIVPGLVGQQVVPIKISGTTIVQNPDGSIVGSGGYYAGDAIGLTVLGGKTIPVATTTTGATVGIPTADVLKPLQRDEYGGFITPVDATPDEKIAIQNATNVFKASLIDPDNPLQQTTGAYVQGDYAYWNGAFANNDAYERYYGTVPYTAEFAALMQKPGVTQAEIDALKKKSRDEMARVLTTKAMASHQDLVYYGLA